jgi:tRNA(adenine34) deaminase
MSTHEVQHLPIELMKAASKDLQVDSYFMKLALGQAKSALRAGEVPVGAVAVSQGKVVGKGFNLKERLQDPTAHAEIIALRGAAETLGRWRLRGVTLYVTLEPCVMCAGAMVQARLGRLVFGAHDRKGGACGTEYNIPQDFRLNHQIPTVGGVLRRESEKLLGDFFNGIRAGA